MFFLLPMLVLAALGMSDHAPALWPRGPTLTALTRLWLAALLVGTILPWWMHARSIRRLERTGRARWITRSRRLAQFQVLAATSWFVAGLLAIDWLGSVRETVGDTIGLDEVLALAPWLLSLGMIGWQTYPLDRLLREASLVRALDEGEAIEPMPARLAWAWRRTRESALFMIIPGCIVLGWWEASERMLLSAHSAMPGAGWLIRRPDGMLEPGVLGMGVQFTGVFLVASLAPALMARILPTKPLKGGTLAAFVRHASQRHRVRPPTLRLWDPTQGFANAAVLGFIPRTRTMLVTRRLLGTLSDQECEAVAMHEIGHVRHRHIPWMIGAIIAVLMWGSLAEAGVAALGAGGPWVGFFRLWLGAALPALTLVGVFAALGYISRRFEWQADAFAAADLSRQQGETSFATEACAALAHALLNVTRTNGSHPSRSDYLHGSVHTRCRRLAALEGTPLGDAPIDRACSRLKGLIAVALASGVACFVLM
jgi:Zn-dependent protease with chaperone function